MANYKAEAIENKTSFTERTREEEKISRLVSSILAPRQTGRGMKSIPYIAGPLLQISLCICLYAICLAPQHSASPHFEPK